MYSVVLMVAATSGGDMAGFGGHKDSGGCTGAVASASCHGNSCSGGGFLGMRSGGGLFKHKDKGGCHGSSYAGGCTGAAPAPVVVAAPAPTGCTGYTVGSSCHGGNSCHGGGGFLGMKSGGGLFKHKSKGCNGGCYGG